MSETLEIKKSGWMSGFNGLGIVRQVGLMVGLAASVAVGFGIVLWSQEPDYRVLYSDVDYADSNRIIEQLQINNIDYKFDPTGRTILVPNEDLHRSRLKLSAEGYTGDNSVGFESLDQQSSMGSSQFMESARYRRALEGELARTIASMNLVHKARVHLAIPKESSFIRDARKPRASVFLDLKSGATLEAQQVQAIANMVASSIPELSLEDVTVVDQKGRLLSTKGNEEVALISKQLTYTRSIEETLLNRVNSILEPVVGIGNFRAEVSVDVDFTQVERADEMYSSEPPVLRSEQTLKEEKGVASVEGGVPGALSNTPAADGNAPEVMTEESKSGGTRSGSSREQKVANYEVDRTVSYTKQQSGKVTRIAVAVVVDEMPVAAAEGEENAPTTQQWSDEDLARLQKLVENAVGVVAERGDSVTVINSSFFKEVPEPEVETNMWEENWFWDLMKQAFGAIAVLVLILGVLRPILKTLATTPPEPALTADDIKLSLADDGDDGYRPQDFDAQVDEIRSMVAEDPAKVAQAVRQWVIDND